MKYLWALLLLISVLLMASCANQSMPTESFSVPQDLRYCDVSDYMPKAPLPVRTPKILAQFANSLEISREKLIAARNSCDEKRDEAVRLLDEILGKKN